MTKIDQALEACRQDAKMQPVFYDLFLNSLFFIPTIEEVDKDEKEQGALPLLVEADGKSYLLLFDTVKRLTDWADEDAKYAPIPGHAITEMSLPNLHWALNYGSEYQKQFEPEEIEWLKDVVRQAKADDDKKETGAEEQETEAKEPENDSAE